ncbi:class I SAM-dependent methyltransferase [Streptomyces sp. NBC_00006]|uniref:class I SAM-dependent methyltransferase n=1 Tax=Streptomyces sp. NBC_00006 TaxID=2975619 RepID=UPI00338D5338
MHAPEPAPRSCRSVVDLACGTGFYNRLFKRRGATDVWGIDVSGEMVVVARRATTWPPPSTCSTIPRRSTG